MPPPRRGSPRPGTGCATGWPTRLAVNGEVPRAGLRRTWPPDPAGVALIEHAVDLGVLSTKGAGQVTTVAWTLADLAGKSRPGAEECALALAFWTGRPDEHDRPVR
jgi:magnesium chelatase family protein